MTRSDKYRTVTATFRGITRTGNAIIIDNPPSKGAGTMTLPRSLLHGADDLKLERIAPGYPVMFRLVEWKAEEIGLA
jgi:hypothetical protein